MTTKVCCILGHRYGPSLVNALLRRPERAAGQLIFSHAFLLHPSNVWTTAGYSYAQPLLDASGVTFSHFHSLDDAAVVDRLREVAPDYVLVCGLRKLLGPSLLSPFRDPLDEEGAADFAPTFIAFHPSDLPHGAGLSPIQWALLNNDATLTVTAFLLGNYPIDGGPIVAKHSAALGPVDAKRADSIAGECVAALIDTLAPQLIGRTLCPVPQPATPWAPRRQLGARDRWLDFGQPASLLLRKVRAFAPPYGGCFGATLGGLIWVGAAEVDNSVQVHAGESVQKGQHLIVGCADASLRCVDWRWVDDRSSSTE